MEIWKYHGRSKTVILQCVAVIQKYRGLAQPIGCLITYHHLVQEKPKTTWCLASGKVAGSCARICVMAITFFSAASRTSASAPAHSSSIQEFIGSKNKPEKLDRRDSIFLDSWDEFTNCIMKCRESSSSSSLLILDNWVHSFTKLWDVSLFTV